MLPGRRRLDAARPAHQMAPPACSRSPGGHGIMTIATRRASAKLAGTRPVTVLIIEDDTAIRGLVAELLLGEGYAGIEAADSREGLRDAQQLKPDLILLDLGLPLTLGLDMLETLRSNDETRHIPVVV